MWLKLTVHCKWFEWGLDIIVCNLHHARVVMYMPHMVVEVKMSCIPADNRGCRMPMDYSTRSKCSHAMSYVSTAQQFQRLPFGTIVQQHLFHLCIWKVCERFVKHHTWDRCCTMVTNICCSVTVSHCSWTYDTLGHSNSATDRNGSQVQSYRNSRRKIQRLSSAAIHSQLHRIHLFMYSKCADDASNVLSTNCLVQIKYICSY